MCNLPAADRVCFNCSLEDCKENRKDCPRKKFIKDNKDYKEETHRKKDDDYSSKKRTDCCEINYLATK